MRMMLRYTYLNDDVLEHCLHLSIVSEAVMNAMNEPQYSICLSNKPASFFAVVIMNINRKSTSCMLLIRTSTSMDTQAGIHIPVDNIINLGICSTN
jgi:hypothetical protein